MTNEELKDSWQDDAHTPTVDKGKGEMRENKKMATLRESAMAYETPQTLNIADLDKIQVDLEVKQATKKNKDGEEFTYLYAEIDNKEYRIAGSILGGIKALLKKMPSLKYVSVIKDGQGMNTRYQVVPVVD